MRNFFLEIITPARQAYSAQVDSVVVPTPLGNVGVLAAHEPLFSALVEGEVKIREGARAYFLAIGGGFMQVAGNKVSILVTRASDADELNESEIRKAQEQAKLALSRQVKGLERAAAQAMLQRSFLELKVLHRKKRAVPPPVRGPS